MKYIIIQLCCFDCKHFENIFVSDDYIDSITSIKNFEEYDYIIYCFYKITNTYRFLKNIDGYDLI